MVTKLKAYRFDKLLKEKLKNQEFKAAHKELNHDGHIEFSRRIRTSLF